MRLKETDQCYVGHDGPVEVDADHGEEDKDHRDDGVVPANEDSRHEHRGAHEQPGSGNDRIAPGKAIPEKGGKESTQGNSDKPGNSHFSSEPQRDAAQQVKEVAPLAW